MNPIILLLFIIILSNSSAENVISLPNEECRLRPTLINVDTPAYRFYPLAVSLNRCDGICNRDKPSFRKCLEAESTDIKLLVFNELLGHNETVTLKNHTSCQCKCAYDSSVCSKYQVWDADNCKCVCNPSPEQKRCTENYIWNPNLCQCECNALCENRKVLNELNCTCNCEKKYYERCNRQEKLLRESDCRCYLPKSYARKEDCDTLPTKWIVIVIVICIFCLLILLMDCILYSRKSGCLYCVLQYCCKSEPKKDETYPINKTFPQKETETNI